MNDFIVLHPLKKWYIVAANRWIIVAANPRYIYVRELTESSDLCPVSLLGLRVRIDMPGRPAFFAERLIYI